MMDDGSVYAWGLNSKGQLGTEYTTTTVTSNGSTTYGRLSVPYQVTRGQNEPGRADADTPRVNRYLHEVVEIAAGDDASWFINTDHEILMNGSFSSDRVNANNQYSVTEIFSAVRPTYFTVDPAVTARNTNGVTYPIAKANGRPQEVYAFDAGADNLAFITGTHASGKAAVWMMGVNTYGQLGQAYTNGLNAPLTGADREEINSDDPVQVYAPFEDQPVDSRNLVTLPNVTNVAVGDNHSVFYQQGGTLLATGLGTSGQLGNGATASKNLPVRTGTGSNTSAKITAATVREQGGAVVASYSVAPDFVSMGLEQELVIDVSALKLQLSDG